MPPKNKKPRTKEEEIAFNARSLENAPGYTQRYYIMNTPSEGALNALSNRIMSAVGAREMAHQILHWSISPNRPIATMEAAVTEEEHQWMMNQPRMVYIGSRDPETGMPDAQVTTYLEANADDWTTPKG